MRGATTLNEHDAGTGARRAAARRTAVILALVAVAFYFGIMLIMASK